MIPYERTVKIVSALLYSFDPHGMGMSLFAPDDEYDDQATRLVSQSKGAEDIADVVKALYPDSPDLMVSALIAALGNYRDLVASN